MVYIVKRTRWSSKEKTLEEVAALCLRIGVGFWEAWEVAYEVLMER